MSNARHLGSGPNVIEDEAIAWVQKLASGEATREDVEALARWRAQSPAREAAFVEASRAWSSAGAAARLFEGVDHDIFAELDALRQRRKTLSRRLVLGGGVAAIAAATAYGAVRPPLGLWPSLSELQADYHTSTGEQSSVTFAGDIAINLNTQTSLAVRSAAGAMDRIELILGEASFVIPARAERSLGVFAAGGETVANVGKFDVRYTRGGELASVSVTCFEGGARIQHGTEVAALKAGERVHYGSRGLSPIVAIDPVVASEWQRGIVEFRGTPLAEAVEEINRYRPGRIILMNQALGQKQLSGRFRIDQMNMVLEQLEYAFNVRLQRFPGGIVVLT
jgi:transmembrane sensor